MDFILISWYKQCSHSACMKRSVWSPFFTL